MLYVCLQPKLGKKIFLFKAVKLISKKYVYSKFDNDKKAVTVYNFSAKKIMGISFAALDITTWYHKTAFYVWVHIFEIRLEEKSLKKK